MHCKVFIGTSLDGFIARKNGDIDWLTPFANHEAIRSYEEFISTIDAIIIGRGTYEKVLTFPEWPYKTDAFVLSNTIKEVPGKLKDKVSVIAMKPAEVIHFLSSKEYTNIYIDGGKVIQDFLKEDLIDTLIISKVPVLIGNGIPLFDFLDRDLQFEHIKTDVYSNGLVRTHYQRKR